MQTKTNQREALLFLPAAKNILHQQTTFDANRSKIGKLV